MSKKTFYCIACLKLVMENQNNFPRTLIYLVMGSLLGYGLKNMHLMAMVSCHNGKTPITTTMDVKQL